MSTRLRLTLVGGANRRAVGDSRTVNSRAARARRRQGTTLDPVTRRAERTLVGASYGSAMEGHATEVSSVCHLPPALQRVGARRNATQDRRSACARSA